MEFAIVDDARVKATPGGKAICPLCRTAVLAKCGEIYIHHWAHVSGKDCDSWWEPETEWHRYWKSFAQQTEVTIADHRADIVTQSGLIVELQHSNISAKEIQSREACYGSRLRWLFDGTNLVYSYQGEIISSEGTWERDYEFTTDDVFPGNPTLSLRHKTVEKTWDIVTFRWKHPRLSYALCKQPVYIDLPGSFVLKLEKLHVDNGPPYGGWGKLVPKDTVRLWLR